MFFIVTFLFFSLTAKQPYDAIVNLGGDCQVAYQLLINGLRAYALPFDKWITPYDSLQQLLENRFDHFLAIENLKFIQSEKGTYILESKYNIKLLHDFPLQPDFLQDYHLIKETYNRRIARFFQVIENSDSILFIRKGINKMQAKALQQVLHTICGHKNFDILALDKTYHMQKPWNILGIKNFYLCQPDPYIWKGDNQAWQEILLAIGLELTETKEIPIEEF